VKESLDGNIRLIGTFHHTGTLWNLRLAWIWWIIAHWIYTSCKFQSVHVWWKVPINRILPSRVGGQFNSIQLTLILDANRPTLLGNYFGINNISNTTPLHGPLHTTAPRKNDQFYPKTLNPNKKWRECMFGQRSSTLDPLINKKNNKKEKGANMRSTNQY